MLKAKHVPLIQGSKLDAREKYFERRWERKKERVDEANDVRKKQENDAWAIIGRETTRSTSSY